MTHFTLAAPVQFQQEIKKSRFAAYAWPITHDDEIATHLQQCLDVSANHQCWAWKIGQQYRFSDAGEPTGTAGKPILAEIDGQAFDQVLVVVNRWFGGIKLGTGGLVRAYGSSARQCLMLAEKVELITKHAVQFYCHFAEWSILQYQMQQHQIEFTTHYLNNGMHIQAQVSASQHQHLARLLQELTRGREALLSVDVKS